MKEGGEVRKCIIGTVLDVAPQAAPLFFAIGMHCLGCPSSRGETVEEACAVHGVVNDPVFMPPGDMPARIAEYCRKTGQPVPESIGEIIRTIFDSLALCYRYTVEDIACLTGKKPNSINIVGGGSKDPLLSQITADVCGLPVVAGPAEATTLGNLLVQAMAHGLISGISEARELVRKSFPVKTYLPRGNKSDYDSYLEYYLRLIDRK